MRAYHGRQLPRRPALTAPFVMFFHPPGTGRLAIACRLEVPVDKWMSIKRQHGDRRG